MENNKQKDSREIIEMVRNYTKEQFTLAWTMSYFTNIKDISSSLMYMRSIYNNNIESNEENKFQLPLFNNLYPEWTMDYAHINIINNNLEKCFKEYESDYKLLFEVIRRALGRAFDKISTSNVQSMKEGEFVND